MRILITGGAGFIGHHLGVALEAKGILVDLLDRNPLTKPQGTMRFIRRDLRDGSGLNLSDYSAIFHFAAVASVAVCEQVPEESYQDNLLVTLRLLAELKELPVGKRPLLIFSSTSAVYGDLPLPKNGHVENALLPAPRSFYASQKIACEHAIELHASRYGIPATVFRFFNVYGEGQDPGSPYSGVITRFLAAARQGESLTVFGDGSATRDFVAVQDVVSALVAALALPPSPVFVGPINIGSGQPTSIAQLASQIQRLSSIKTVHAPARTGDIQHSLAQIDRAQQLLRWKPQIGLETWIQQAFAKESRQ